MPTHPAGHSAAPLSSAAPRRSLSRATVVRLLTLVAPYKREFILGLLFLAAGSGINLLLPEIIRRLIDGPYAEYFALHHARVGLALVILFAIQGLCFYFRSALFGSLGHRVVADTRSELLAALTLRDLAFFDAHNSNDLVSRLQTDSQQLQDAVSVKLSVLIRYSFQVIVGVGLMVYLSPRLSMVLLSTIPLLVGLSLILGKRLRVASRAHATQLAISGAIAQEFFSLIRVVKAFGAEKHEQARFKVANDQVRDLGLVRTQISAFFSSFVSFLMNGAIVIVLLYGVSLVSQGSVSSGDLVAFLLYGVIVAVSFAFLAGAYAELMQVSGAADRIFELIDASRSTKNTTTAHEPIAPTWNGAISLTNVTFSYPSRPDAVALRDITLAIAPGKTTAIIGPSGAGKSTIISLILGLYPPSAGSLQAGAQDIATLDPTSFRSPIALVPQEPVLFAGTILENVRYGSWNATRAEVEAACAEANILEFVRSLPEQFESAVGERGVQLSAGQKQRLVIARAILRSPKLLLLDEATSALDSENEHQIQTAIERLAQNRTVVVIAHRLATIQNADTVVVLEGGRIVEMGPPGELARNQAGLYAALVRRHAMTAGQNKS